MTPKLAVLSLLCLMDVFPSCGRRPRPQPTEVIQAPLGTESQPRRIDIQVSDQGYTPRRTTARPGEWLTLMFQYTPSAGECGREVLIEALGKKLTLSDGAPTPLTIQVPLTGDAIAYTCGMRMLTGQIAIVPTLP